MVVVGERAVGVGVSRAMPTSAGRRWGSDGLIARGSKCTSPVVRVNLARVERVWQRKKTESRTELERTDLEVTDESVVVNRGEI